MRRLAGWVGLLLLALLAAARPAASQTHTLPVQVGAPDAAHVAWLSSARLADAVRPSGLALDLRGAGPLRDALNVVSLHEFVREVPALAVLELPFFYPDQAALHAALDGPLGSALRAAAAARGWTLLAVWDEGMQLMSGNLSYTHPANLSGREFLLLREDAIAEKEMRALDAWTRRSRPASLSELHKECLVGSRAATAQQLARERVGRVHLDLTLSNHRYEAWVVAIGSQAWGRLGDRRRAAIGAALRSMTSWQRERARREEEAALAVLKRDGMTLHTVSPATWQLYRGMQPAWDSFLPNALPADLRQRLLVLAAGARGGVDGRRRAGAAPADPLPRAP